MPLNDDLRNNPLTFLKTWAICPRSDVEGYVGKTLGHTDVGATATTPGSVLASSRRSEDIRLARIERAKKVAYINVSRVDFGGVSVTGNEGGDRIAFEGSYTPNANWVPVYWLPWQTVGAAIRITIPQRVGAAPGPDIFFTAAINGCSVFFQGSAQQPTIYHAGGATEVGSNQNTAAQFWQEVLADFVQKDQARGKNKGVVSASQIDKRQYIKTPGVGPPNLGAGEGTSTMRAMAYRKWLEDTTKDVLRIEDVSPWACVMGIRTGDDWEFYIQENATVIYHQLKKEKKGMARATETRYVARPMTIYKVFPGGTCIHRVNSPVPRIA